MPGLASEPAHDHPHVIWRFARVDIDGKWGWSRLALNHLSAVQQKCASWETMTANELFGLPGSKPIDPNTIDPEAQKRLRELDADDIDDLWELRLTGKQRIWGFRQGCLFFFLWWDPKHEVYKSKKKHT